jgi:hypothetical protein
MVAVRMVSEGVDIPRLAVGVYTTSVSTALFFAQAVGRFVRARQRGETASVFLPSVPILLSYAAELEAERDHVLRAAGAAGEEDELALAEALRERDTPDAPLDEPAFTALNASAHFDRVLYDGGEFGTATAAGSPEEEDFLGLPGLLDPDQVRTLLRKRQDTQLSARTRAAPSTPAAAPSTPAAPAGATSAHASPAPVTPAAPTRAASTPAAPASTVVPRTSSTPQAPPAAPPVSRQALAALRKELNGLVGAWSHRTGQPHGVIHNELRRTCGGPPLPQATADQIRDRIDTIRRWAISGR